MNQSILAAEHSTLETYLESVGQLILKETLKRLPKEGMAPFLDRLVRDYPLRGGKRFRPALILLSCELAGGDPQQALSSAVALELFHNFALIHDDIEDASEIRRGTETLHRIHGIPLALNAGDFLHGVVHKTLLENHSQLGSEKAQKVHEFFNKVMQKTFEGQAMDIGWVHEGIFPDRNQYWEMIERKTGWYSGKGPCHCGGIIANADKNILDHLSRFGFALGLSFQVRDDVLNLTERNESQTPSAKGGGYGKEQGGDFAEGKRTLITIEMMERLNPNDAQKLRMILLKPRIEVQEKEILWCIDQAQISGAIDATRSEADQQYSIAQNELVQLPEGSSRLMLKTLASFLASQRKV